MPTNVFVAQGSSTEGEQRAGGEGEGKQWSGKTLREKGSPMGAAVEMGTIKQEVLAEKE
jgi:hypothetical protein